MCPAATSGRDYVGPYVCIVPFPGHTDVGKQPSERFNRRFVLRYVLSVASFKTVAGGQILTPPPAFQTNLSLQLDHRPHIDVNTGRQLLEIGILSQCIIGRLDV